MEGGTLAMNQRELWLY